MDEHDDYLLLVQQLIKNCAFSVLNSSFSVF